MERSSICEMGRITHLLVLYAHGNGQEVFIQYNPYMTSSELSLLNAHGLKWRVIFFL